MVFQFDHPLLVGRDLRKAPKLTRQEVRERLKLPEDALVVLFVSEYNFPESEKWAWEQAHEYDIEALLRTTLDAACAACELTGRPIVVVLKIHPAQKDDWAAVCADYPAGLVRTLRSLDKPSLLGSIDIAFGLNSMLLLEVASVGVPVYSYHEHVSDRTLWLSTIHDEVTELESAGEVTSVISELVLSDASRG